MNQDADNRLYFDHGGLTSLDNTHDQLLSSLVTPNAPREFQQEVSRFDIEIKKIF